ncbi:MULTISPECIES: GntR family transcriptional regulator [unclassified Brenneria]|uniref:GntR family transcriptional regulator n=1 Tax=unclassified Brenneria TaxID=2634434 RepID=UPI0018F0AC0F|nr:GntR family transcriptional regulator [Brenneria sp. L3-3C-1]MBJ7222899.1 GntR family transcriptional regulator [Brenneria sp. L3-3C-1]MEE3644138.1 GntR family transcriptional regulator [Brenneria sp. L3_3C_1]
MESDAILMERLRESLALPNKSPLYVRFVQTVQQALQAGEIRQGDFLPSERELSEWLGISRITVRKALSELESLQVVIRTRGYGTYISDQMEYYLKEAQGFTQQVQQQGKKPGTEWLCKSVVNCREEIAKRLKLPVGSEVFCLKRIRYIDDEPLSIAESYVPVAFIHDVDDITLSLYAYFRSQNRSPVRTRSWVSAQLADKSMHESLKLNSGAAVLVVKQLAFDRSNIPIEYSISYCRADTYVFVSEE